MSTLLPDNDDNDIYERATGEIKKNNRRPLHFLIQIR